MPIDEEENSTIDDGAGCKREAKKWLSAHVSLPVVNSNTGVLGEGFFLRQTCSLLLVSAPPRSSIRVLVACFRKGLLKLRLLVMADTAGKVSTCSHVTASPSPSCTCAIYFHWHWARHSALFSTTMTIRWSSAGLRLSGSLRLRSPSRKSRCSHPRREKFVSKSCTPEFATQMLTLRAAMTQRENSPSFLDTKVVALSRVLAKA